MIDHPRSAVDAGPAHEVGKSPVMTTVPARGIAMVNRIETAASGGTRSRNGLVMASGRR